MSATDNLEIAITIAGIFILFITIYHAIKVIKLLRINNYNVKMWFGVITLLIMFVLGYAAIIPIILHIALPIDIELNLIVSFVYFFGAVFTLVTLSTVRNMLRAILGKEMSDDEALRLFMVYAEMEDLHPNSQRIFEVNCSVCNKNIQYSIPSIVRSNASSLERGISVEKIFGTTSYVLRPTHICSDGRRELNIVHDHNLEIRSIESSRLLFGGNI
ncbi:MAG: hypothetical protein OEY49_17785 [Candidatus Heimdallarchaeota archaeon]|nr:hypothetical protein [Candidatus Heimdallarchaeota archaeon]